MQQSPTHRIAVPSTDMTKLLWGLAAVAFAYLGVCAVMFAMQRDFIYRPDPALPDSVAMARVGFDQVRLDLPGGALPALFFAPPQGRGRPLTVLVFHGNAIAAHRVAAKYQPLRAEGWGVALLEYPGYGGMPGTPEEQEIYRWARLAAVEVAQRSGGLGNVVLWGESLGAGVATTLASEQAFAGVILEAPFTSVVDLARQRFPWLPVNTLVLDRYDNLERIGQLKAPLLLLHGARDGVVPVEHGRRLLAAAPPAKRGVFYPAAGHNDLPSHGAMDEALVFLREIQTTFR